MGNTMQNFRDAVLSAMRDDLPDVNDDTIVRSRGRPSLDECDFYHFPQTIGERKVYVTVAILRAHVLVFFDGELAYKLVDPNDDFWFDFNERQLVSSKQAPDFYGNSEE